MSPVERFKAKCGGSQRSNEIYETAAVFMMDELASAVEAVCRRRGLLQIDEGEDDQTLETYRIYTVGFSESEAYPVVLIGNEASESGDIEDLGSDLRPHKLIVPDNHAEIIQEVKEMIEEIEEKRLRSASGPRAAI